MSLTGALHIGRSGLLAHQAALQVTGNNLANLATKGYHRQTIEFATVGDQPLRQGVFMGRGVQIAQIVRQVDEALETRIRDSIGNEAGSLTRQDLLSQIESLQGELGDSNLSTHLTEFFNAWSQLANRPDDFSLRTLVLQRGGTLSTFLQNMQSELGQLRERTDDSINNAVSSANDLLSRIEQINGQISQTEAGSGGAHSLRDQRDLLLSELSQYMDVSLVEQASGAADVFVGSTPVILNGHSRGLEVRRTTVAGELRIEVVTKANQTVLQATSGKVGALIKTRDTDVNEALDEVDKFANQLIFEINKVHAQGQGLSGFGSLTSQEKVLDATAALDSEAAGLAFTPTHGSFQLHLTQKSTGQRTSTIINIDLDQVDPTNNTSLQSLAAQIDGIDNVTATVTAAGKLKITSDDTDYEFSFSDDSSGALAALGLNTFFTGHNAHDIAVNGVLSGDPGLLATGLTNQPGDNGNALALANLGQEKLPSLGGASLQETWGRYVQDFAIRSAQTQQQAEADSVVRTNLESQQAAMSGVNADEEAVNLLSSQRAFQGSARFLATVDEMLNTLISLLG